MDDLNIDKEIYEAEKKMIARIAELERDLADKEGTIRFLVKDYTDNVVKRDERIAELQAENKRQFHNGNGLAFAVCELQAKLKGRDELLRKCWKFIDDFIDAENAGEVFCCSKSIGEINSDPLWKEILTHSNDQERKV